MTSSKPPIAHRPNQNEEEEYYLNNSNAGSLITTPVGLKNQAANSNFEVTATQADFERDGEVDLE